MANAFEGSLSSHGLSYPIKILINFKTHDIIDIFTAKPTKDVFNKFKT